MEKRKLVRKLRERGVSAKADAAEVLLRYYWSHVGDFPGGVGEFLERLGDELWRGGSLLDVEAATMLLERIPQAGDLSESHVGENEEGVVQNLEALQVIDAFAVPRPKWVTDRHEFALECESRKLRGSVSDKSEMFENRYHLLLSRLFRNPKFRPSAVEVQHGWKPNEDMLVCSVDALIGARGTKLVMGMLSQLEDGIWYIEDGNASVQVDIREANVTGLITENSFVLVAGSMRADGIFDVSVMGSPEAEVRSESNVSLGDNNFFGGIWSKSTQQLLLEWEKEDVGAMFMIFSDIWLDSDHVIESLEKILIHFNEQPPSVIVFMGSFLSRPFGQGTDDILLLSNGFLRLGQTISKLNNLANECHFIFVPSSTDPGPGPVSPRPPIPDFFLEGFRGQVKHVHNATNPCRVRYCTQEFVIFRNDTIAKMNRYCAKRPKDMGDTSEYVVKALLDQAHLCPLPLEACPVIWNYDASMWLFPLPHVVILGDRAEPFSWEYKDCHVFNPGSFPNGLCFSVYLPSERKVQPSCLPTDDER